MWRYMSLSNSDTNINTQLYSYDLNMHGYLIVYVTWTNDDVNHSDDYILMSFNVYSTNRTQAKSYKSTKLCVKIMYVCDEGLIFVRFVYISYTNSGFMLLFRKSDNKHANILANLMVLKSD